MLYYVYIIEINGSVCLRDMFNILCGDVFNNH